MADYCKSSGHNYGIDLYRFVLITWIVLYHYTVRYNDMYISHSIDFGFSLENGGHIGVSLFFMVSGFYMMKSLLCENYGIKSYAFYLSKRYYRLWLPYFLACIFIYLWLLVLPLPDKVINIETFLINLPLIYHPGIECVDNAHWFIGDLFVLQVIIGITILIKKPSYRKYIIVGLYLSSLLSCILKCPYLSGLSKEIFEVTLGMLLYMAFKEKKAILLVISIIGISYIFTLSLIYFAWIVIFVILQIDSFTVYCPNNLKKVFSYLGTLSFYWYLVHQNIGYSIFYYIVPTPNSGFYWLLLPIFITLLISVIVSLASNKVGELLDLYLKKNKNG